MNREMKYLFEDQSINTKYYVSVKLRLFFLKKEEKENQ